MTKRTLTLRAEHLAELSVAELDAVVGAASGGEICVATGGGGTCDVTKMPTVPDVNRCPTLFC